MFGRADIGSSFFFLCPSITRTYIITQISRVGVRHPGLDILFKYLQGFQEPSYYKYPPPFWFPIDHQQRPPPPYRFKLTMCPEGWSQLHRPLKTLSSSVCGCKMHHRSCRRPFTSKPLLQLAYEATDLVPGTSLHPMWMRRALRSATPSKSSGLFELSPHFVQMEPPHCIC
jgi:hypothetical protein